MKFHDPEQLRAQWRTRLEAKSEAELAAVNGAIVRLYGALPSWLPEPWVADIQLTLASLHLDGLSTDRIVELVAQARKPSPLIPPGGKFPDREAPYMQSIRRLARLQRALELGPERGLLELAGSDAVIGRRIREQRRAFTAKGNAGKRVEADRRKQKWLAIGRPLRERNPGASDSWLAREIAKRSNHSVRTIRGSLRELGLARRK